MCLGFRSLNSSLDLYGFILPYTQAVISHIRHKRLHLTIDHKSWFLHVSIRLPDKEKTYILTGSALKPGKKKCHMGTKIHLKFFKAQLYKIIEVLELKTLVMYIGGIYIWRRYKRTYLDIMLVEVRL